MSFNLLGILSFMLLLLLQTLWNVGYFIAFAINYDLLCTIGFASFESSQGNLSLLALKAHASLNASFVRFKSHNQEQERTLIFRKKDTFQSY